MLLGLVTLMFCVKVQRTQDVSFGPTGLGSLLYSTPSNVEFTIVARIVLRRQARSISWRKRRR